MTVQFIALTVDLYRSQMTARCNDRRAVAKVWSSEQLPARSSLILEVHEVSFPAKNQF